MIQLNAKEKEAARHLLWHLGYQGGVEPGSFTKALLEAWSRADANNSRRLMKAFPEFQKPIQVSHMLGAATLAEALG